MTGPSFPANSFVTAGSETDMNLDIKYSDVAHEHPLQLPFENSNDSALSTKRQMYTSQEWEKIRPIFTKLYIDQQMTLQEAMEVLSKKYEFNETENMYKKRIRRIWKLSKYMKAEEKEKVIVDCLRRGGRLDGSNSTRTAIILRHARQLSKAEELMKQSFDQSRFHHQMRYNQGRNDLRSIYNPTVLGSTHINPQQRLSVSNLNQCLALPTELRDAELLLHVLRDSVLTIADQHHQSWMIARTVDREIYAGSDYQQIGALTITRRCFERAGNQATDLICRYYESLPILLVKLEVFNERYHSDMSKALLQYVNRLTQQTMGPNHAFTEFALILRRQPFSSLLWKALIDCLMDHAVCQLQKSSFAKLSLDWWFIQCRELVSKSGIEACIPCYEEQEKAFERLGLFGEASHCRTLLLLAVAYAEHGCHEIAEPKLLKILELPSASTVQKAYALQYLAFIYGRETSSISHAGHCYLRALRITFEEFGAHDIDTLFSLQSLLEFCRQHYLIEDAKAYIVEFADSYQRLVEDSEGLWDIEFEAWIAAHQAEDSA